MTDAVDLMVVRVEPHQRQDGRNVVDFRGSIDMDWWLAHGRRMLDGHDSWVMDQPTDQPGLHIRKLAIMLEAYHRWSEWEARRAIRQKLET